MLFTCVLILLSYQYACGIVNSTNSKIAFMFLSRGVMPFENIWMLFFQSKVKSDYHNVYIHTHPDYSFKNTSFFYGREINQRVFVERLRYSMVIAIRNLVHTALEDDSDNEWFCLISEACVPLIPFSTWYTNLIHFDKTIMNACEVRNRHNQVVYESNNWKPFLNDIGVNQSLWRKSSEWFAMLRKHAIIFAETKNIANWDYFWNQTITPEEHTIPTLLAYLNLSHETTCTNGYSSLYWNFKRGKLISGHPIDYGSNNVNKDLIDKLRNNDSSKSAMYIGYFFRNICSGVPNVCHFTARKFRNDSLIPLLNTLNLTSDFDLIP